MGTAPELEHRFKIRAPLRCQGVGSLACAEDRASGERVAIRWIPLDAHSDSALEQLAQLPQHPAIPGIRLTGRTAESAYIVMDFPEGKLLAAWDERIEVHSLCQLGLSLAEALEALHSRGMVHGELSVHSVLLRQSREALLWDLPLVLAHRQTERRGDARLLDLLAQIAPYLPPEVARGEPADFSADIYALAAVLCLCGGADRPPGGSTLETVHLVATGAWCPTVPAPFPSEVRRVLQHMLMPAPAQRPSAGEVQKALRCTTADLRNPVNRSADLVATEILDLPMLLSQAGERSEPPAAARENLEPGT